MTTTIDVCPVHDSTAFHPRTPLPNTTRRTACPRRPRAAATALPTRSDTNTAGTPHASEAAHDDAPRVK